MRAAFGAVAVVSLLAAALAATAPAGTAKSPGFAVWHHNGCGACHTFKAAASTGKIGPALTKAGLAANAKRAKQTTPAYIRSSIVTPSRFVVKGYKKGLMPPFTKLSKKDLADLVLFIQKG